MTSLKMDRSTLACDKCRALKVKCIQSKEGEPCQKCTKAGIQCIVSRAKRPTGTLKRRSRISELDTKLSGILDLLSRSETVTENDTTLPPSFELGANSEGFSFPELDVPLALDRSDGQLSSPPFPVEQSIYESSNTGAKFLGPDTNLETPDTTQSISFGSLELSSHVPEHLLNEFRSRQSLFPFVIVSPSWNAHSMAAERPFLLLAVLASTSSKYPRLQKALAAILQDTLANRVVIKGERDIDLLQGLLVHLAWFHFYWIPRSQQMYSYLQIAISVMIDLGLDQPSEDVLAERADLLVKDPLLRSDESRSAQLYGNEGTRAYLGCFHLSAIISISSAKPNSLLFTDFMLESAQMFQQNPEYESDCMLYPLIQLQKLAEESRDLYRIEKAANRRPRLHTHASRLMSNLAHWKYSLPVNLQGSVLLNLAYYGTKLRIYEMGLVYRFGPGRPPTHTGYRDDSLSAHPTLISNLVKCTDAAKEYLDCFLTVPVADYHSLPLEEWLRVILAPFVLYRLSVGLREVPDWTTESARQTVDLTYYFDQIFNRLKAIQADSMSPCPFSADNLFAVMPLIFENVKKSFIAVRDGTLSSHESSQAHQDLGGVERDNVGSFASTSFSSANERIRCPGTTQLPRCTPTTPWHGSGSLATLDEGLAAEIHSIESERLWTDFFMEDTMMTPSTSL